MENLLDLDRYPLHRLEEVDGQQLVRRCTEDLARNGMFTLPGFLRQDVIACMLPQLQSRFAAESFTHAREHNIYFDDQIAGLEANHPALRRIRTVNHTLCGDQLPLSLRQVYEWPALTGFLARVMGKSGLYPMADPLADANVMCYHHGEGLNWHFDRSEFTTTLLLQPPERGGEFQYRQDLRSETNPNYEGVSRLLKGEDSAVRELALGAGDLNVFRGKNTAHRVTPTQGGRARLVAVFTYYDMPGRVFSDEENLGFYGRTASEAKPVG